MRGRQKRIVWGLRILLKMYQLCSAWPFLLLASKEQSLSFTSLSWWSWSADIQKYPIILPKEQALAKWKDKAFLVSLIWVLCILFISRGSFWIKWMENIFTAARQVMHPWVLKNWQYTVKCEWRKRFQQVCSPSTARVFRCCQGERFKLKF